MELADELTDIPLDRLPTPNTTLSAIISCASGADFRIDELVALIERDPKFSLISLRLANMANRTVKRVLTVRKSVMTLGARAIRNQAVAEVARALSKNLKDSPFDVQTFWEGSVRRAVAARILAEHVGGVDPAEAFTLALVQDIGVIVLVILHPEHAEELQASIGLPVAKRSELERELFGISHDGVFGLVGRKWGLPEDMVLPIAHHHAPEAVRLAKPTQRMTEVIWAADLVADFFQARASANSLQEAQRAVETLTAAKPMVFEDLAQALRAECIEAGKLLDIPVGQQPSILEMLSDVTHTLIGMVDEYERQTQELHRALHQSEELSHLLDRTHRELLDLRVTDPLTGATTRKRFGEIGRAAYILARDQGLPLSIVMVHFSALRYLQMTLGDDVATEAVRLAARRVFLRVRGNDRVCRVAFDALAILVPGADVPAAEAIARRIRESLECDPMTVGAHGGLTVGAQLGGATTIPSGEDASQVLPRLMRSAHHAMEAGRSMPSANVPWAGGLPDPV